MLAFIGVPKRFGPAVRSVCEYHSPLFASLYLIIFASDRKVDLTNIKDRREVERMYVSLLVFGNLFASFLRIIMGPFVFAGPLGVVVAIFVTAQHSEMPIYVYVFFPVTAASGFKIQVLNIYGGMYVIRICDAILHTLVSADCTCLMRLSRMDRELFMMTEKSLPRISLPLGEFAKFSLNSMWNLTKEIVSQVLVLVSL